MFKKSPHAAGTLQKYLEEFEEQIASRSRTPDNALIFRHASIFIEKNPHLFSSKKDVRLYLALLINEVSTVLKKTHNKHNFPYTQIPYVIVDTVAKFNAQWEEKRSKSIAPPPNEPQSFTRKIGKKLKNVPHAIRSALKRSSRQQ